MKRSLMRPLILAALLVCFAAPVQAQGVPTSLTHQGRLVDENGVPLSGDVELTYTIYDAATGGAILWQGVVTAQLNESGFYSVELGWSANPITAAILSDGKAWMGVTVEGGDELTPRLAMNSVPFALRAGQSQVAVVATSVAPGSITSEALAADFALSPEHLSAAQIETLGGLSCANGEVAVYNGSNWECGANVSAISAGAGIAVSGSASAPQIGVEFGTSAGTAVEGNDSRLSNARTPTAGSEHYIQNQTGSAQNASFHIGGSGTIGGNLHLPTLPVASGYASGFQEVDIPIKYEHLFVNNGGHYDPLTGFFTAPVHGLYQMCASMVRESDSWGYLNTWVEGSFLAPGTGWLLARNERGRTSSGCIIFPANAGDRIGNYPSERGAQCSSGNCHFSIKLVTAL